MAQHGRILQFDDTRGYGFIAPDTGGEDIFMHVNELQDDERRISVGTRVEFEVMDGGRGRKAFAVRVVEGNGASRNGTSEKQAPPADGAQESAEDEGMCDVLTEEELRGEITEMLLGASPELSVGQILRLRGDFLTFAMKHGWSEGNDVAHDPPKQESPGRHP